MLIVLAEAGGYVDDAVAGLQDGSVYVSPEVGDATALAASIDAQIGDASVGVAVFSDNAALEASGPEIVGEIAAAHPEIDTIVVAVGDDLSAGSRVLDRGEAMQIATEAEQSGGDLEEALTQTVQGVLAASDSPTVTASGGLEGIVIGLAIGAAVLIGGAVAGVAFLRRGRPGGVEQLPLPEAVRNQVQTLRSLSAEYA